MNGLTDWEGSDIVSGCSLDYCCLLKLIVTYLTKTRRNKTDLVTAEETKKVWKPSQTIENNGYKVVFRR
jgi:hypothetical protein